MLSPARTVERAGVSILVFGDAGSAGRAAALRIQSTVHAAVADRGRAVLGLATGATPQKVYSHLVAFHREGTLSFRDVVTYNLDEFYPIGPLDPKSYRSYMHQHLFSHVDLAPHHAHLLDGTVSDTMTRGDAPRPDSSSRGSLTGKKGPRHHGPAERIRGSPS